MGKIGFRELDKPRVRKGSLSSQDILKQLDPIFRPKSIAVIGASHTPGKWGYRMVARPMKTGYRGAIYPVTSRGGDVLGLKSYSSVLEIPDEVDLAVIVVPAAAVPQAMSECVQKGIKGAIIISAGFAETGEEGRALQEQTVAIARKGGVRFVGPNSNALFSSSVNLNLTFDELPLSGSIAFVSQSGTFGSYLVEIASAKGYGVSKFVSIGNQADLVAADYLEYLMADPNTRAIVLYMEGFPEGGRFFRVAREVVRHKPVIVYKAGRTEVGIRATRSHTGSMAASDQVFDGLCQQVGLLRAYEVVHPFDMAEALVHQPLPKGNRVAIIGSGGQGVVASESCASLGLEVPELDEETVSTLQKDMSPHAPPPRNPIDFAGGSRTALDEARVADKVASLDYIDGLIMNMPVRGTTSGLTPSLARTGADAAEVVTSIPRRYGKPVIALRFPGAESQLIRSLFKEAGIPSYDTPEECARAMYALVRYAQIRRELGDGEKDEGG